MKQAAFPWPLWAGDEDWFRPLFPRGCVRVTRIDHEPGDPHRWLRRWGPDPHASGRTSRVTVWGNDDSGMSSGYLTPDEADALLAALPNPLTVAWLTARGFHHG